MNAIVDSGGSLLADVTVKVTLVLAATWALFALRRRGNASGTHLVGVAALGAMLALPVLAPVVPTIALPASFVPLLAAQPPARRGDVESVIDPGVQSRAVLGRDARVIGPNESDLELSRGPRLPQTQDGVSPQISESAAASAADVLGQSTSAGGQERSRRMIAATLIATYAAGLTVFGTRWLVGLWRGWRLMTRARRVSLPGRLGEQTTASIFESDEIDVPATLGVMRRIVLLSPEWREWSETLLASVLAHECAHVRRRDAAVAALATLNRAVYWFHPGAWWLRRRLAELAEQVCDDAAIAATGNRVGYARDLLTVASRAAGRRVHLAFGVAMARTRNVERRIDSIIDVERPLSRPVGAGRTLAVACLAAPLAVLVAGLRAERDSRAAQPAPAAESQPEPADATPIEPLTLSGQCTDGGKPFADARIQLLRVDAARSSGELVAEQRSDGDGKFSFANLTPPPNPPDERAWHYALVATAPGRASGLGAYYPEFTPADGFRFDMSPAGMLSGRITDDQGRPVAGAQVWTNSPFDGPFNGLMSATTDPQGRYQIVDLRLWDAAQEQPRPPGDAAVDVVTACYFRVRHPDFGGTRGEYQRIPAEVDVELQPAATIVGLVFDQVAGAKAAGVIVSMQATDETQRTAVDGWRQTRTDAEGRYRLTGVAPGKYNIWADAKDRTCAAVDSLETTAGKQMAAPILRLAAGGWIEGQVFGVGGKPLAVGSDGRPIRVGLYGPARPKSGAAIQSTKVDGQGRFRMRSPEGTNYPYICVQMPGPVDGPDAVEVREGKTTAIEFRVLPGARALGQRVELPPVELPAPVETEREAAGAIRKFGGWYKLDDDNHIVEVNMVYYEDKDGRRDNDKLSDEALEHVAAFPRLKTLLLKEGQASDAGLRHLRGMEHLERIYMWDAASVTDEGAAHLGAVPNLAYIHLTKSQITDEAIHSWQALPKVYGLSLQENRFTDLALEYAGAMPNLRELFVGNGETTITDEGLAHLQGLANLERLDLQKSRVTDAGMAHLAKLGRLRTLWLGGTAVTRAGLATLKAAVPDLDDANAGVGDARQTGRRGAVDVAVTATTAPKLAYLAWQVRDDDGDGPAIGPAWDADGNLVDAETNAALRELIREPVHMRIPAERAQMARPLVLWFADGSALERRTVMPQAIGADGQLLGGATAIGRRLGQYRVSAVAPEKPFAWGEKVSLTMRYAISSPEVVKELREVPQEPVELGGGVDWVAQIVDDDVLSSTMRIARPGQFDSTADYGMRIYARGKQWPVESNGGATHTFNDRTEQVDLYKVKAADVDLIRLTRQSYATVDLYDVPVRLDLLPAAEAAAED